MARPRLKRGDVIRFNFLYSNGDEEDRPAIVAATIDRPDKTQHVYVMPITHSPRRPGDPVLKLKAEDKAALGLNSDKDSYIVVNEINSFDAPGFDWQRVPGKDKEGKPRTGRNEWVYGTANRGISSQIDQYLDQRREIALQSRDEPEKNAHKELSALHGSREKAKPKPATDPAIDAGSAIERAQAAAKARDEAKSKAPEAGQDIDD